MGRKSIKENKNIYQLKREELGYTRSQASDQTGSLISQEKIEKIESGKIDIPHPDDIKILAEAYKDPYLCNYYCSNTCPIGKIYVPKVDEKSLSQIVLEMIASLNSMESQQQRLIEISADGVISADEMSDFKQIQSELERISVSVESLQLLIEKTTLL